MLNIEIFFGFICLFQFKCLILQSESPVVPECAQTIGFSFFIYPSKGISHVRDVPFEGYIRLVLHWHLLECALQQLPELWHWTDLATLVWSVRMLESWTEADDVETWILAQNDRALKTGMNHVHLCLVAELTLVDGRHHLDHL